MLEIQREPKLLMLATRSSHATGIMGYHDEKTGPLTPAKDKFRVKAVKNPRRHRAMSLGGVYGTGYDIPKRLPIDACQACDSVS